MQAQAAFLGKDPAVLMESCYILVQHYNRRMNLMHRYMKGAIPLEETTLTQVVTNVLPKQRLHHIMQKVFEGMEPPLLRHPVFNTFILYVIPEKDMTDVQKARVQELRNLPSGTVLWENLTWDEQLYIYGSLYGMIHSINQVLLYLQYTLRQKHTHPREESTSRCEHPEKKQKV